MLPTKAAPRILQGGMLELEQLAESESQNCSPETICACVAKTFGVRTNEVALLESSGSLLKFLYPSELKSAGVIPISSSAAAARTARTRRADLFNTFTRVQHSSVFEVVKLGDAGTDTDVIQKLMSAPIFSPSEEVIGVIQGSRKARTAAAAGPDFTADDLHKLRSAAILVGRLMARSRA